FRNSTSSVTIGDNTNIMAAGDVSLEAKSTSLAVSDALFWFNSIGGAPAGFSFCYVEADTHADVTVSPGATISAGGDVLLSSYAQNSVDGSARVLQNASRDGSPANPDEFEISIALGFVGLHSYVTVDAGSTISAVGNVAIDASGKNSDSLKVRTAAYGDGLA